MKRACNLLTISILIYGVFDIYLYHQTTITNAGEHKRTTTMNNKLTFKTRINFSGKDFQNEFNNYDKALPTFEEVSEEVICRIINNTVVSSSHKLTRADETYIIGKYNGKY